MDVRARAPEVIFSYSAHATFAGYAGARGSLSLIRFESPRLFPRLYVMGECVDKREMYILEVAEIIFPSFCVENSSCLGMSPLAISTV